MAQNLLDDHERVDVGSDDHTVAVAFKETAVPAQRPGGASMHEQKAVVKTTSSGIRDSQSWVVHVFAAFYLVVLTVAWFIGNNKMISSSDYIAQAALVLTSIGLYHAPPPGRNKE
jgi:hypothetical protein